MMKQTRLLMGMPITLEIIDPAVTLDNMDKVFAYFVWVDETFSIYKPSSEMSQINRGTLRVDQCSEEMRQVLELGEQTRRQSHGYFDIVHDGRYDPTGIVKGWAVHNAACMLSAEGFNHFYIDAGGDIQLAGTKETSVMDKLSLLVS
jgi:thiamine biosynthesis lipoprotein